jgi:hypothetical protein
VRRTACFREIRLLVAYTSSGTKKIRARYEQILLGSFRATNSFRTDLPEPLRTAAGRRTGPGRCFSCHCNNSCYKYVALTRSRPCYEASWHVSPCSIRTRPASTATLLTHYFLGLVITVFKNASHVLLCHCDWAGARWFCRAIRECSCLRLLNPARSRQSTLRTP